MEIHAIAGPMNKEQADTFRKRWKTPPRGSPASFLKSPTDDQSPMSGSPLTSYPNAVVRQRYTPNKAPQAVDLNTGIEKTSRRLFDSSGNEEDGISTSSKTILFQNYRDRSLEDSFNESLMSTPTSNAVNNSYNDNQYNTPGFKERNLKLADVDKGLEVIGRGLAKGMS